MKKFLSFILFIVLVFSLSACNEGVKDEVSISNDGKAEDKVLNVKDEPVKDTIDTATIKDYYPFAKNRIMEYEGTGNEYAERKTFVEFIEEDTIQIKTMNSGTDFVNVLEYKDGVLREVFGEGEFYHIENMLNVSRNMDNIILKEPLELGNTWQDKDGNKVEITGLNEDISTPSGKYKALEVTTTYKDKANKKDYYVKDIGLVGSLYKDGDFQVKTLLRNIEDSGIELPIKVYYPMSEDIGSKYVSKNIIFKTNDNIKVILEKLLKNPNSNKLLPIMPENTSINKINLNRDNWNLEVDLAEGFINEMNAGSSYEIEIINSMVNTLGSFYDVERVYITVGGSPYESGHLQLLEDQYFEVNTSDIEELKIED